MRKPVIAGNWKMYKTLEESLSFLESCIPSCREYGEVEIILCPTFLSLASMKEKSRDTDIKLGAQNTHWEKEGAFTGEVSPFMLSELGIDYVIIGHSERRNYFGEKDEGVNKKVKAVLNYNLKPIMCLGETLKEREENLTYKVVERQLERGLEGVSLEEITSSVIAYEPVWAIGTGRSASAEDADQVISFLREKLSLYYGYQAAQAVPLLYGGSVKPDNIGQFLEKKSIDGALIGGASLEEASFIKMVEIAHNMK
ncbi:MAG: triose-phosphate isomerase [Candidatus Syntrophonatronum acetioxidans]|uniref:Triosephosphate isomerase n=2 Tax=Candidatus Syntrophonatronum acetioxidans TaxID=1795816 RepID=A0A424Y9Q1_9FIRM|nr:MAG: triose-phosphate isomerase [Candidatus Syntrophonatronum acetioxidans]